MLSPHFRRAEFACGCKCGFDTIDTRTLEILEAVRGHFGRPVMVTSGARCAQYNRDVGGAPSSQHLRGRAADIQVRDVEPAEVHAWVAKQFPAASLGLYQTFVHIDTRSDGPARW